MQHKNSIVKKLTSGVEALLRSNKVDIFKGVAKINKNKDVVVDDSKVIKGDKIILAGGSKVSQINLPGINHPGILSSDTLLDLKELPETLAVIGGGVIGIEMAHQMAEGKSVKLDGIGTFSPSLALCKDKEREKTGEGETHRNARSIVVGNVNFRVDRKMIRRINGRCLLERAPWKSQRSSQKYTPEQRLALAVIYLEEHPFLTVYEYRKLTGLLRTA